MKKASKPKKELNTVAKCRKDNSVDDDKSEAPINNVETLDQQMKDIDKHLQEFDLRCKDIDVCRLGWDKIKLAESKKSSINN